MSQSVFGAKLSCEEVILLLYCVLVRPCYSFVQLLPKSPAGSFLCLCFIYFASTTMYIFAFFIQAGVGSLIRLPSMLTDEKGQKGWNWGA